MKSLLSFMLASATVVFADTPEAIQCITLDERVVFTVPVATNRVTTISFPGPIAAIDAAGVTTDQRLAGQFLLGHTKGSAFFSVKALAPKASANVNVRWGKNTYVFQLEESSQPILSLILEAKPTGGGVKPAPIVSPTRLL